MKFTVGFVVYDGFQLQQVAGPMSIFEAVSGYSAPVYKAVVLSARGGLIRSSAGIHIGSISFRAAEQSDVLFISGGYGYDDAVRCRETAEFIRSHGTKCRHITAVSSGTMVLAASGLLDRHRVTTHWSLNKQLAELYPSIDVESDEFVVRDERFWTTSTVAGGMEIARLIVDEDLGHDFAVRAARELLSFQRPAIGAARDADDADRFKSLLNWARANLRNPLSVEELASQMDMLPRNFIPAFTAALGQTPAKAIERIRLEEALALVGTPGVSLAAVARQVGFTNVGRMRRAFIRAFAVPPQRMQEVVNARRH
ncbi:GlxA family transcriptional regulator [Rhizorhabdus argentea]|uniref:GlxA family transcriptional regulator n=1 Tax=Rhizorhabdus argentea TaxID=1387174 RepID=UPI0030EE0A01